MGYETDCVRVLFTLLGVPIRSLREHPPHGHESDHDCDVIAVTATGDAYALEVTKCYQGDRSRGDALAEHRKLEQLRELLRAGARKALPAGCAAELSIYLNEPYQPELMKRIGAVLEAEDERRC